MNFSQLCNCIPFPTSALIFFLYVHINQVRMEYNKVIGIIIVPCLPCLFNSKMGEYAISTPLRTTQVFLPPSLPLCDRSVISKQFFMFSHKNLLNPHGVAPTERNSLTYQGQFLSETRNLSALMYCNITPTFTLTNLI